MATCASCGKEIRDNDWTCGNCGAPVATSGAASGSGAGSSGYASSYEPPADYGAPVAYGAPAAPPAMKSGLSHSTVTIIIVAALAVVAIIAVWFFFVRGTGGTSPFLGTWNEPNGGAATVEITLKSGDFKVKMTGTDASGNEKAYTIPAHLDGSDLAITVDDFVKATGDKEKAAQAKAIFETLIKDFRIVFTVKDPTHLKMAVEGTPVGGTVTAQATNSSTVLVKDD
ncbi:MAG: zinc ribbon domain-containing protein [Actinobacteria bacterium]|nr:zinc ribbon domain-containing protein [Actinomycetota bacterium]